LKCMHEANHTQQRCSIHRLVNTTTPIPLQVVEPALPGAQPRLWIIGGECQVLPGHEPDSDMAGASNHILHAQDMDAADRMG
jgi:hypothetical protein